MKEFDIIHRARQMQESAREVLGVSVPVYDFIGEGAIALYRMGCKVVTIELPDEDEEHEHWSLMGMPPDGGAYRFTYYPPHD